MYGIENALEDGPSAGMIIAIGKPLGPKGSDSGLGHRLRGTLYRGERDIDDEDTTAAGDVANTDLATVRPHRFPSDRESEAEARPIAASAIAKCLKQVHLARRKPATLVLSLDEQPTLFGSRTQYHVPS